DSVRAEWEGLEVPQLSYHEAKLPNYEQRDPPPKMQEPLSPEESQKLIQVPPEFDLELFASEPDIINPVTMSFDERGRLWVVETVDYPNQVRGSETGDDRIKILEDTDGDGKADKFTVFADSLNIPTSLVFANDGVIVAQAPHFLFLKDTDGDDRADVQEVLMAGWGKQDTHAGPSNLQYGPDNRIWGTVGYSGFEGAVDGEPFDFNQVAFRFKPDGTDMEVMTNTTNNTWGLGFTETFDISGSTANNDPSWYMAIPNRYFEDVEGLPAKSGYQSLASFYYMHPLTPNIRQVDVFGGYTAAAGHYLYTARAFPKEYWNRIAFINEPTGHLIGRGIMEKDGAGFVTKDGWSLLASADEWVSPVHAQVGPDGALWVADWYNFIVQHNPTPEGFGTGEGNAYETDLRDRSHGRIYRIVYKEAPEYTPRSLSKDDPEGLLDALASDNQFWRLTAQRLLVERGERDVVPQLLALVRDTSVDEVGLNGGALHALWTLHGLGAFNDPQSEAYQAALQALEHPAAGVRKAALQVLPRTAGTGEALLEAGLLADPDLHTRLSSLLALADVPASEAVGEALYAESLKPENYSDTWLSRALYIAASRHPEGFLAAYNADPNALSSDALPIWLRLGDKEPDWSQPGTEELVQWQDMEVPGNWEQQGLPDLDGIVWFTRTFEWEGGTADSLHLGQIAHRDEVWLNGTSLEREGPRWGPRTYPVPEGVLQNGENTITVRIENFRGEGGFVGEPEDIHLASGAQRTPLSGTWKYRIERQTNATALYQKAGELAAHLAWYYGEGGADNQAAGQEEADDAEAEAEPDVVLTLGVIEHQLKYDQTELTVEAGQMVELVFENTDLMQHNVVVGEPGSTEAIGAAADELATSPDGMSQQYIPDVPQVLAATELADPGQTVRLRFQAPEEPGEYPYVCTFPGHWRIMQGVLRVTPPSSTP
ncbi:MAG: PVC-type heme-binding CxxCH protein, partial [Rhodothermales bacterium]